MAISRRQDATAVFHDASFQDITKVDASVQLAHSILGG
jgi:hypothetical protein